jgi:hypothetical protein
MLTCHASPAPEMILVPAAMPAPDMTWPIAIVPLETAPTVRLVPLAVIETFALFWLELTVQDTPEPAVIDVPAVTSGPVMT